jgi:hypothetical protein
MGPEGVRPSRNHRDVISDLKPARTNAAENIFSASLSPCQSSCVLPWHDDISMSAAARPLLCSTSQFIPIYAHSSNG